MNTLVHGYAGFAKYANKNYHFTSTIYCASDESRGEVFLIPLTIGCFSDLYQLVSELVLTGSRIRIFPISIQYDYISDIYNIVTTFGRQGHDIMWVFPKAPSYYYSEEFEVCQNRTDEYSNSVDLSLSMRFIESGINDLYDIQIFTPAGSKYFTLYLTEEKLETLLADTTISDIHISSYQSRHGGLDAMNVIEQSLPPKEIAKFTVFNINNGPEYIYFKRINMIGKEVWYRI